MDDLIKGKSTMSPDRFSKSTSKNMIGPNPNHINSTLDIDQMIPMSESS